jgi:hypothetical protein
MLYQEKSGNLDLVKEMSSPKTAADAAKSGMAGELARWTALKPKLINKKL